MHRAIYLSDDINGLDVSSKGGRKIACIEDCTDA